MPMIALRGTTVLPEMIVHFDAVSYTHLDVYKRQRLGYGLVSPETDVTLEDIARYTDVFYIGGTKVGALCGEAVVFTKKAPKHFMTMVKQQGALLAKGRLLGIQFDTLFTDDLYTKISKNAIETAMKLKKALQEKGYQLYLDSPTNQQQSLIHISSNPASARHSKVTPAALTPRCGVLA